MADEKPISPADADGGQGVITPNIDLARRGDRVLLNAALASMADDHRMPFGDFGTEQESKTVKALEWLRLKAESDGDERAMGTYIKGSISIAAIQEGVRAEKRKNARLDEGKATENVAGISYRIVQAKPPELEP